MRLCKKGVNNKISIERVLSLVITFLMKTIQFNEIYKKVFNNIFYLIISLFALADISLVYLD